MDFESFGETYHIGCKKKRALLLFLDGLDQ